MGPPENSLLSPRPGPLALPCQADCWSSAFSADSEAVEASPSGCCAAVEEFSAVSELPSGMGASLPGTLGLFSLS